MTPCDFLSWGYLKGKVFSAQPPDNVEVLKQNIRHHTDELERDPVMIRCFFNAMVRRTWDWIDLNGGHVEGR